MGMKKKKSVLPYWIYAGQSAELWERWKRGEGMKAIGRMFGKPSSCIFKPPLSEPATPRRISCQEAV